MRHIDDDCGDAVNDGVGDDDSCDGDNNTPQHAATPSTIADTKRSNNARGATTPTKRPIKTTEDDTDDNDDGSGCGKDVNYQSRRTPKVATASRLRRQRLQKTTRRRATRRNTNIGWYCRQEGDDVGDDIDYNENAYDDGTDAELTA